VSAGLVRLQGDGEDFSTASKETSSPPLGGRSVRLSLRGAWDEAIPTRGERGRFEKVVDIGLKSRTQTMEVEKMKLKKAGNRGAGLFGQAAGRSKRSSTKRFWFAGVIAAALFLATGPEVQAQYKYVSFTGVNYANATQEGGYTVTNAINHNGNTWDVTVKVEPTWRGRIATSNKSGSGYLNPKFPNAEGIWFGKASGGPHRFTFTFIQTAGTDPLDLLVHSGESVNYEMDKVTTSGTAWEQAQHGNMNRDPVISGTTATFKDYGSREVGWWSVQTTLPPGKGTVTYSYTHLTSSGNNMIAFQAAQATPTVDYDYGDAPWHYDNDAASAARHALGADLWLGRRAPDRDDYPAIPWELVDERDDNDAEGDDEDGVLFNFPPIGYANTRATVTVVNHSSEAAQVCCWLDGAVSSATGTVNVNGAFEDTAPEKKCAPVPAKSGRTQRVLSWYFPNTATTTYRTYARCRLSTASTISPTGALADGEVEDYRIVINEARACTIDAEFQDFFDFLGSAHQPEHDFPYAQVRLTPGFSGQAGAVMSKGKVDFREPFTIAFNAYFGYKDRNGADGIAAVFHNDPRGSGALGLSGSALGAGGIQNGIALEFDTYQGAFENWSHWSQRNSGMDHTSIWDTDKILGREPRSYLTKAIGHGNLEDGRRHDVEIRWDPVTQTLSYTLDSANAGSYTYSGTTDFVTEYFGGAPMVHFGITAATGGLSNAHAIRFPGFCKLPLGFDADGDGVANIFDIDDDNDGITDCVENGLQEQKIQDIFALRGSAIPIDSSGGRQALLTPDSRGQAGAAMSKNKVDFREPFTIAFRAHFGHKDGADGMAAVFHNDPRGSAALGLSGSALGAGGIQNGIALEFDTYNGSFENWGSDWWRYDWRRDDHTSIWDTDQMGGYLGRNPRSYLTTAIGHGNIEDGFPHDVEIRWDPVTEILAYTLDGNPAGTYTYSGTTDFVTEYFDGAHQVHFGITAATGGLYNFHSIRFGDFCKLPLEIDTDGDGLPNHHDLDSDADGISDLLESGAGDDGSPVNYLDWHNDGEIDLVFGVGANGLANVIETANGVDNGTTPRDTDNDGTPDYHDLYSDADSCPDAIEGVRRYAVGRGEMVPSFDFGDIVSDGSLDQSVYPADDHGRHDGTTNQGVGSAADSSVNACAE